MNLTFLVLIAIPLGLYLLVMMVATFRSEESESVLPAAQEGDNAILPNANPVEEAQHVGSEESAVEPARAHEQPITAVEAVAVTLVSEVELANSQDISNFADSALLLKVDATTDTASMTSAAPEAGGQGEAQEIPAEKSNFGVVAADESELEERAALEIPAAEPKVDAAETTRYESDSVVVRVAEVASDSEPAVSTPKLVTDEPRAAQALDDAGNAAPEQEPSPAPQPGKEATSPPEDEPTMPKGPVVLPNNEPPKYAFDYRGRLWVEKKNKGFFRILRRPQLPPEEPPNKSER